jgi:cytochrome c oxidase subunit 3
MWLFLATEILLFGGLFCAYAVYRANHPEIFIYAHTYLDKNLGAINTVVLLCSSLTMAWAVRAAQLGQQRLLVWLLALTLLGGGGFLGIKYVEYEAKWEHGLLWAARYAPHDEGDSHAEAAPPVEDAAPAEATAPPDDPAASDEAPPADDGSFRPERTTVPPPGRAPSGRATEAGPDGAPPGTHGVPADAPHNVQVFFSIYFLMTGLHGLHVIAGIAAIAWVLRKAVRGAFGPAYFTPVDLVGLYWHLVDMIWIFLFPLLYLIH